MAQMPFAESFDCADISQQRHGKTIWCNDFCGDSYVDAVLLLFRPKTK